MRDLKQDYRREKRKEIQADEEEACEEDTDPAMTAAGSTTTRGSGFFCVSLERKEGKIIE